MARNKHKNSERRMQKTKKTNAPAETLLQENIPAQSSADDVINSETVIDPQPELTAEKLVEAKTAIENEQPQQVQNEPVKSEPIKNQQSVEKEKPQVKKAKYSFPTKVRCPRCRSTDNIVTSTPGKFQYRQCRQAVCRINFPVEGTKI
ncbi:MAG TPA: hypothetical protein DCP47_02845 [Phycisphaerales bacterium]|nr:hypothetical protein [Phycisphaerales bacterium]